MIFGWGGTLHAFCCLRMGENASVLIVDDEPGVRESLRAILAGECEVHTAASGADALALIESIPVDVVTLDLRMPGLDGIHVLKRIKEFDQDIEALIISGYNSFEAALDGLRLRAFDYVSKPFDIQHVRTLVRQAVAQRQARRRLRAVRQEVVANLSEAFQQPIDMILGDADPQDGPSDALTAEQRATLDLIRSNSSALARYLDGIFLLLDLATGDRRVNKEIVCVADVLEEIAGRHRMNASQKGLTLSIDCPRDTFLETDGTLLGLLLDHLTDNAVRFTINGGVSLAVTTPANRNGVTLTVSDTGDGIPVEQLETLQQNGSRAGLDNGHHTSGVALGLQTVTAIARRLGGRLDITSRRGHGSVISVSLPKAPSDDEASRA